MLFTVFTPTYNRAHLLGRLFESLQRQTARNFEWLIVDDGSEDETEASVAQFIAEADFPVRYFRQRNQGKHIAINAAVEQAHGDWYLPVDSDDFLADSCLEICERLAEEASAASFGGFTFIHAPEELVGKTQSFGTKKWSGYNSYEWDFEGEMHYVFKMEMIRKFPFPVFEDENFCQESVQIIPIVKNHTILYTDHILAFGDYLEDGLSQNLYARLLKNPRYAMLAFKTKLKVAETREERVALTQNYWDIVLKTKQPILKSFVDFPVALSLPFLGKKILNKLK